MIGGFCDEDTEYNVMWSSADVLGTYTVRSCTIFITSCFAENWGLGIRE